MALIFSFPHPHDDVDSIETAQDFLNLFESEVQRVLPMLKKDLEERGDVRLEPHSLFRDIAFKFVVNGYNTLVFVEGTEDKEL